MEQNPDANYSSLIIYIDPTHCASKADWQDHFPLNWKANIIGGTHSLATRYMLTCKKPGHFNHLLYLNCIVYVGLIKSDAALITHNDNADFHVRCKYINAQMIQYFHKQFMECDPEETTAQLQKRLTLETQMMKAGQNLESKQLSCKAEGDLTLDQIKSDYEATKTLDVMAAGFYQHDRSKRATLAKYIQIKFDDDKEAPGEKKNAKQERSPRKTLLEVMIMKDLLDAEKETQQGGQHSVEISFNGITGEAITESLSFTQADQDTSILASSGVDIPKSSRGGEGEGADRAASPEKDIADKAVPDHVKDSLPNL
ncbi:hypothetical protein R1flu_024595 [Riccia fluitans]|uniref:Uncharacterized protein n=1 Tax=Riccia fluitans TaxID=41844 RepID=A0ABD1XW94_9MARC